MATLTINYIANYAGNHRVCYRQVGTTNYCCLTHVVTTIGPQTFTIDFSVPADYCFGTANEVAVPVETECGPYEYEGYVQPGCEPEGSLLSITPWGPISFTQDPSCLSYDVECTTSFVQSITLTNSGYALEDFPTYTFTGGGPCSTPPTITIDSMTVTNGSIAVGDPGTGYQVGEILTMVGGVGTAATFTVTAIQGGGPTGPLAAITLATAGSYTTLPAVYPATTTATGSAGPNDASFYLFYGVEAITLTNNGTACTSPVSITFNTSAEIAPTADVTMAPCPVITTPSCGTTTTVQIGFTHSVVFCESTGTPVLDPRYTVTPQGTCCDCKKATVTLIGGGIPVPYVYYTDATTNNVVYLNNSGAGYIATLGGTVVFTGVNVINGSIGIAPGVEATLNIAYTDC